MFYVYICYHIIPYPSYKLCNLNGPAAIGEREVRGETREREYVCKTNVA